MLRHSPEASGALPVFRTKVPDMVHCQARISLPTNGACDTMHVVQSTSRRTVELRYYLMHSAPHFGDSADAPHAILPRSPSQSHTNGTVSPEQTSPLSLDLEPVFDAITALLSRCPDGDDASLRPLMCALVAEAHRAGVHAEILLRLLKEGWRTLPDHLTTEERLKRAESLNRVVTLCICEFYRADT